MTPLDQYCPVVGFWYRILRINYFQLQVKNACSWLNINGSKISIGRNFLSWINECNAKALHCQRTRNHLVQGITQNTYRAECVIPKSQGKGSFSQRIRWRKWSTKSFSDHDILTHNFALVSSAQQCRSVPRWIRHCRLLLLGLHALQFYPNHRTLCMEYWFVTRVKSITAQRFDLLFWGTRFEQIPQKIMGISLIPYNYSLLKRKINLLAIIWPLMNSIKGWNGVVSQVLKERGREKNAELLHCTHRKSNVRELLH